MSSQLSLEQANAIIKNAFDKGAELGLAPLTIVVLDAGGHLKAMQRADSATFFRPQIAFGKAWGSLALGMASRTLFNIGEERPMFMNSLIGLADQKLVPVPGGVLVRDTSGEVIAAVGITGDTSDNDEACAIAGIEAVSLVADAGK
ncbi:MAG: heme-binding protein [Gammaproteobacteria bacterium]|nr:heme-binding protein [Gammaproteobacteria bacterium]